MLFILIIIIWEYYSKLIFIFNKCKKWIIFKYKKKKLQRAMTQFILDLKQIFSQEAAKTAAEILASSLYQGSEFKKQIGKDFLNKCLKNLQDQKASSQLKFYTLYIFKYFDSKQKVILKIFSLLSGHPLYTFMVDTAKNIDPRKSVNEKGKGLFPDNKQLGVRFMRLLLQSLKLWAERFPQNSNQQPTKYKKAMANLLAQKVNFPTDYTFYGQAANKRQQKTPQGPPESVKQNEKKDSRQIPNNKQGKSMASQINFLFNKIQIFIALIQDEEQDDIDQFQRELIKNHQMFKKDKKKFEDMNPYDSQPEETINLFLQLNQFLSIEETIYKEQIVKNQDLKTFCDRILIQYGRIFQQGGTKRSAGKRTSEKPKGKEQKDSQNERPPSQSTVNQRQRENKSQVAKRAVSAMIDVAKDKSKQENQSTDKSLSKFFSSIMDKSKRISPGFKAIRQSLQKQKKQIKLNPPRGKSPHASGMSRSRFDASTVSKLKAGLNGIFANPPNPNVGFRKYQGEVVYQNSELQDVLYQLKRDQGVKRFKISHMKNRSLLFQNQHFQIGYKSQPLYHQCQQFEQMIELELFMGNKTTHRMNNLQVKFHGDQRSLIYTSPEKVQQSLNAGEQVKFQVVIIPRTDFFNLTNMRISYIVENIPVHTSCILPASLLKFTNYFKADKRQIRDMEYDLTKSFQTEKFRLCHYFPPRKIAHYIEQLVELTDYSDFAEAGSETDFELGGSILIKNKYQALLKVIIRPDLTVVLMIKAGDDGEEAIRHYRLYLQTLLLVLKEAR